MATDKFSPVSTESLDISSMAEFERALKRKRESEGPLTPPISADETPETCRLLEKAVNVLSIEATALSHVTRLYQTDPVARDGLSRAIDTVVKANEAGGKMIICGVGKSGLVGMKTTATMKSLGLGCSFMHAAEALHGDLGDIRSNDILMFITYSGRTAELMAVLPHVPDTTPVIVLTSHTSEATCAIHKERPDAILLPAPIHELEEVSFGVNAPTTSTTVAMAIGDMLALSSADKIHDNRTRQVFLRNHPGGAIGVDAKKKKLIHK